jgi:signal transduction histidine kinase
MPRTRPPSTRLEFRAAAVRLLRELLSKVTKHAQATLVDIRFRVGIEVSLAVIDNGVGPGEPQPKRATGCKICISEPSRWEATSRSSQPSSAGR